MRSRWNLKENGERLSGKGAFNSEEVLWRDYPLNFNSSLSSFSKASTSTTYGVDLLFTSNQLVLMPLCLTRPYKVLNSLYHTWTKRAFPVGSLSTLLNSPSSFWPSHSVRAALHFQTPQYFYFRDPITTNLNVITHLQSLHPPIYRTRRIHNHTPFKQPLITRGGFSTCYWHLSAFNNTVL